MSHQQHELLDGAGVLVTVGTGGRSHCESRSLPPASDSAAALTATTKSTDSHGDRAITEEQMRGLQSTVNKNEDRESDIWSLPHDPVLSHSGPTSVLTVYSSGESSASPRLLRVLDVEDVDPQRSSYHHFQSRRLIDGEHKIQALTLFALGSVLLLRDPSVSLYLHECRRLHAHLESRLVHGSLEPPRYWLQDLDAWSSTPGFFAIDEATQLHLRMAGLLVTTRPTIRYLSPQAISNLVGRQLEDVRSERAPREQAA